MAHFTLYDLSQNAFRTLGLTASAAQSDIDATARKFRIWDDPAQIPPSPNDAPWLGPIIRTRQNIEDAVARLAQPESRVQERLWWFCLTPPPSDAASPAIPATITAQHDAALVQLYRALVIDAGEENAALWQGILSRFETLAASDDYLAWLLDSEANGDFEKSASADEVATALAAMPARLSTFLVSSVEDALATQDFAAATQIAGMLGRQPSLNASGSYTDPETEVLSRMEDTLSARCNDCAEKINTAWKTRKIITLRSACVRSLAYFEKSIDPLISELLAAAKRDRDRRQRAIFHGVKLLDLIAQAQEAMYNFVAAERTLTQAQVLAQGSDFEANINERIEAVKPAARRQRIGVPPLQRQVPQSKQQQETPKPAFRPIGTGNRDYSGSWFSHIPLRLVLPLVVTIVIFLIRFMGSRSPPDDPPNAPTTLNLHQLFPTGASVPGAATQGVASQPSARMPPSTTQTHG